MKTLTGKLYQTSDDDDDDDDSEAFAKMFVIIFTRSLMFCVLNSVSYC